MRFPTDIVYEVLQYLDPPDLARISALNSTLKHVADRLLYRNIEPSLSFITPCLKMLVEHPNLATTTQRLTVHVPFSQSNMSDDLVSLLSCALHSMPALTALTLFVTGPLAKHLLGCPFRLRSLTTRLDWDKDLVEWLDQQTELNTVRCTGMFVRDTDPPSALRKLSHISAIPEILASVVPHRPVQGVEIDWTNLMLFGMIREDLMGTLTRILSFSEGPLSLVHIVVDIRDPIEALCALRTVPQNIPGLEAFALQTVFNPLTLVRHASFLCPGLSEFMAR